MIRNLRQILREKNMSVAELSRRTGIQASILQLIMIGAFVPFSNYRRLIADAIGEYDHTIFESGLPDHKAPIR